MTPSVLVADIGKSTTRVAVCRDGVVGPVASGPGIAGLAASRGVADAIERIQAVAELLEDPASDAAAIGVAGALSAPDAAQALADRIAELRRATACVTSDVVTAHLGALDGGPGTILVAGTGAVAFGVFPDGSTRLADGRGPELGDHGSGYWIGREGMRAALRAGDRGVSTALAAHWSTLTDSADSVSWLASQQQPVAAVARFAPFVLDAADDGDAVAVDIVERAVDALTTTARAASDAGSAVALLGGLSGHDGFRRRLTAALLAANLRPQAAAASAMSGAATAALRTDLPHERLIYRAG